MEIDAIVLAGGFATRLRPLSLTTPKPLLPILDKPLLDWTIDRLRKGNLKRILLSIRYLAEQFERRYGDGSRFGVEIKYLKESIPLGDGGPIRLASKLYGFDNTLVVFNGDIFTDINICRLLEFHRRKGGVATIALTEVDSPERYGIAVLDDEKRILKFIEKPPREKAPTKLANMGIYVFEPEILKYFPSSEKVGIAKDLLVKLANEGLLYGYFHKGVWMDIGVPGDYLRANFKALDIYYPSGHISENAIVSKDSTIIHPVYVGAGAYVEEGAKIGPYVIINEKAKVDKYSRVERRIIFPKAMIGKACRIKSSIISRSSIIGDWVTLDEGVIIGDSVVLGHEVSIAKDVIILPYKELNESIEEQGKIVL